MEIKKFIDDFERKKINADPTLPKYQELIKREIRHHFPKSKEIKEKREREAGNGSSNFGDILGIEEKEIATMADIPPHIKEVLEKDYNSVENFLDIEKIPGFNDLIRSYLTSESGWGIDLQIKQGRPGIDNSPNYVSGSLVESTWIPFEDQIVFGGINKDHLVKSRPGWIERLFGLFSKSYADKVFLKQSKDIIMAGETKRGKEIKRTELTVEDFFNQVKIKTSESKAFINHLREIFNQINSAKKMGQVALLEGLAGKMIVEIYEGALWTAGMRRFIDFSDLISLENKSPKGLSIDLVQNFARLIPKEVVEKKELADQLQIFDQYVVLHFDPNKKNVKETTTQKKEKEEARKKDPILFGLILDSPRLYYIADWVDEFCDLTWDKALNILGEKEEKHTLKIKK